jgi:hypothetical protein
MLRQLPSGACGGRLNGTLSTLGYEAQRDAGSTGEFGGHKQAPPSEGDMALQNAGRGCTCSNSFRSGACGGQSPKKAKGPPRKKPKRAGASGSGVSGPAATVAGMMTAPTVATHVTPATKKRKARSKPTAQLSGASDSDSGAAELPSAALPAPMRIDDDEMMPSTQAPQKQKEG